MARSPVKYELTEISKARLILCEGPHDKSFFRALIDHYQLPPAHVVCSADLTRKQGRSGFGDALFALRPITGFDLLEDIIIATDSDDDAAASFQFAANLIANVPQTQPPEEPHTYPVPTSPHLKAAGSPSVTILLLPWLDRTGSLETLCFEAASKVFPANKACVDAFSGCTGSAGWLPQKRDKMLLRSIIAGSHEKKPDIALSMIWSSEPNLIPISDQAFWQVRDFLKSL